MESKYAPFENFLSTYPDEYLRIFFKEIENIIGASLPKTAYLHDNWWANTIYQPFMKIILRSGWRQKKIEMFIEFVEFERVSNRQLKKNRLSKGSTS
tara:strand:- start:109 stop:399 length:291 start_codon:yes stop_codon:yes gene_type:complete